MVYDLFHEDRSLKNGAGLGPIARWDTRTKYAPADRPRDH